MRSTLILFAAMLTGCIQVNVPAPAPPTPDRDEFPPMPAPPPRTVPTDPARDAEWAEVVALANKVADELLIEEPAITAAKVKAIKDKGGDATPEERRAVGILEAMGPEIESMNPVYAADLSNGGLNEYATASAIRKSRLDNADVTAAMRLRFEVRNRGKTPNLNDESRQLWDARAATGSLLGAGHPVADRLLEHYSGYKGEPRRLDPAEQAVFNQLIRE